MPINWKIEPKLRMVSSVVSGVLTASEVLAMQDALRVAPEFDSTFDVLSDLRAATDVHMTVAELRDVAERSLFHASSRQAIVAPRESVSEAARAFALLVSGGDDRVKVFDEMTHALLWLADPPP